MAELPCLNCDLEVPSGDLYCSELCKQTAGAVRYARAVIADGRIKDPDVQAAVQIKMASVLGGGYPEGQRRLSPDERLAIFEREFGSARFVEAKPKRSTTSAIRQPD